MEYKVEYLTVQKEKAVLRMPKNISAYAMRLLACMVSVARDGNPPCCSGTAEVFVHLSEMQGEERGGMQECLYTDDYVAGIIGEIQRAQIVCLEQDAVNEYTVAVPRIRHDKESNGIWAEIDRRILHFLDKALGQGLLDAESGNDKIVSFRRPK